MHIKAPWAFTAHLSECKILKPRDHALGVFPRGVAFTHGAERQDEILTSKGIPEPSGGKLRNRCTVTGALTLGLPSHASRVTSDKTSQM